MTVDTAEAVVIGGGVIGCAVLLELAARGIDAILVESEPDVCEGASKANSAIIHTGFDARPGSIEGRLLRRAAEAWPGLLEDLGVPSLTCGALMLAFDEDEAARLRPIAATAAEHGAATEIVDPAWLGRHAPYVDPGATAALLVPDEGIVDPFWLTRAYAEAAIAMGARLWTHASVSTLNVTSDHVDVGLADGRAIRARQAFDCAGVRADEVAALAGDESFALTPRKGQFLVSEHTAGVDRIILPIPGPLGKGMLVTPIVFGGVLLGPTAEDGDDKSDRSTTEAGRSRILAACRRLVPGVDAMEPIRSFAGVRAVSSTGDYIIRPSASGDRLTIVAGIRSTGISASPAISEAAVELAAAARGWGRRPSSRVVAPSAPELASEAGPVVCVCRSVGTAEVDAALAGATAVRTTDALKRRCGVGFGDCQGNRCLASAIERVAAAESIDPTAVDRHLAGSWLIASIGDPLPADAAGHGRAPRSGRAADARSAVRTGSRTDAVVLGGGLAGIGAALALADADLGVTVVDRGARPGGMLGTIAASWWTDAERAALGAILERVAAGAVRWLAGTTAVGLGGSETGWVADLVADDGTSAVEAPSVVLATGGYLMPREHRAIDGPRPSGIMTADFVADALDRGWRPGRRIVVIGQGRTARGTAERLVRAGVEIVATAGLGEPATDGGGDRASITAVRGDRRLEAVAIGGRWVATDGLVLADALRPASFLLRGLGIGDDRPGVPMPVDDSGALPLPGLWAAGTCVDPRVDHDHSLAAGTAVARALLAAATGPRPSTAGARP
jgi:glycerol-3-phosphate dehydrogenase